MAWYYVFVLEMDPDIFTGYNINAFDFPFLVEDAELLGLKEFPYFRRHEKMRCRAKEMVTITKAYGTHKTKIMEIPGQISFDT